MPEYQASETAFLFLIMTQLLIGMVFGYSHLLIARGYEQFIARFALITLVLSISISMLLIYIFSVSYTGVAISTFVATSYYMFAVIKKGKGIIGQKTNIFSIMKEMFPIKFALPLVFLIIERIFLHETSTSFLPIALLVTMNWRSALGALRQFIKLFSSKEYTKF
ncbi:MAG: hypothetical protein ACOCRX_09215 [Candidatus Woesearchaeota archaeon]